MGSDSVRLSKFIVCLITEPNFNDGVFAGDTCTPGKEVLLLYLHSHVPSSGQILCKADILSGEY